MCGRYTVNTEEEIIEIREILKELSIRLANSDNDDTEVYGKEMYPSGTAPIITAAHEFKQIRWGLDKWKGNGVIFNARSETAAQNRFFSGLLDKSRCVIPAQSYFEWQKKEEQAIKYRFKNQNTKHLFMAGIMQKSPDNNGKFVILTREAAPNILFIHDRMPVILDYSQIEPWLSGKLQVDDILRENKSDIIFEKTA